MTIIKYKDKILQSFSTSKNSMINILKETHQIKKINKTDIKW